MFVAANHYWQDVECFHRTIVDNLSENLVIDDQTVCQTVDQVTNIVVETTADCEY